MPHVSPRPVNARVSKQLYTVLFSALTNRRLPKKEQHGAFQELLTSTEKTMLGKRLAAVSLLSQGANPNQVAQILRLSPTTTSKIYLRLENGTFVCTEKICNILRKGPLRRYLEGLLTIAVPPRYGTGIASVLLKEY